ncbi:MJ1255/VC2487 family glycosyltransferase [uncultured Nitrosomonas sp.]|uniref:MJ1255/VC2487 family glycosyltransferase n=1 Tax=uncultured Nitrosomonas sp. TaxID=156424 RepID=UPI0025D48B42|nr:MJ1255/VC2487 family glycosyltransferase [uncultured Nitrosomonas sp.]
MKIFYGIQGTGNGHITRGRIMAKELQAADLDVTYQFSGRPQDKFFDMEVFNGHQWRHGLTFVTEKGKINHLKTVWHSKPLRFLDDINQLDLSSYDLVICDYEPVTAWAARRQNKKTVGISHQYAFQYNIPRAGNDLISETIMQNYAPVNTNIGLHWHHFDQPLLPPVIETPYVSQQNQKNKIIVYLPFEDQRYVMSTLAPFKSFDFFMYSPEVIPSMHSHIYCNPLSLQGFQRDLSDCAGIICNAGFELASESLQLGKKILVKPLHAQMEQVSNALALHTLGYGQMMHTIDATIIEQWLHETRAIRVTFPNTARYLVQWIQDGMPQIEQSWCDRIWSEVRVIPVEIS